MLGASGGTRGASRFFFGRELTAESSQPENLMEPARASTLPAPPPPSQRASRIGDLVTQAYQGGFGDTQLGLLQALLERAYAFGREDARTEVHSHG